MKIKNQKIANSSFFLEPNILAPENLIETYEISSDSVVAKVLIKLKPGVKKVKVQWGDNKATTLDFNRMYARPSGIIEYLENGVIQLKHEYELPENKRAFQRSIWTQVESGTGDDFRSNTITITPRFHVFHNNIQFRLLDNSEGLWDFNNTSQWQIEIKYDSPPPIKEIKKYYFEFESNVHPFGWITLRNSGHMHELNAEESMTTRLSFEEVDLLLNDTYFFDAIYLDVFSENTVVNKVEGPVEIKFTQNFQLIRPISCGIPPFYNPL